MLAIREKESNQFSASTAGLPSKISNLMPLVLGCFSKRVSSFANFFFLCVRLLSYIFSRRLTHVRKQRFKHFLLFLIHDINLSNGCSLRMRASTSCGWGFCPFILLLNLRSSENLTRCYRFLHTPGVLSTNLPPGSPLSGTQGL